MQIQLNKNQLEAVQYNKGPLLIIAGAGTGKTAVITQRIIHIINEEWAKPSEILALTFTEKASAEMEERVDMSMPIGYEEPWISTFHSFCDQILRQEGAYIGLDTNYILMSSAQSYILFRKNLFEFSLDSFRPLGNPTSSIGSILTHFSRLQDEATTPDDYIKYAKCLPDKDVENMTAKFTKEQYIELANVYKEYTDLKIKESRLDFGDLILHTLSLFKQRPNILEKYRKRFKYILVDEYQDTNYTQNVLINMLTLGVDPRKATKAQRKKVNLTVVGDDDQSIYKFRGAAISNILQFKETYPEAKNIVLTENYRSSQPILDASYQLISYNNPYRLEVTEKIDKKLVSRVDQSKSNDAVQLMIGEKGSDEAFLVAREILKLTGHKDVLKNDGLLVDRKFDIKGQSMFIDVIDEHGEFKFSDVAILVRANAHAEEFVQVMKHYGIPFKFAGPKGLYSRPEISILISFLKTIVDKTDGISMFNILKMNEWGLSPREVIEIMQMVRKEKISILDWLEQQFNIEIGLESNDYEISSSDESLTETIKSHPLLSNASNLFGKIFTQEAQIGLANLFVSYDIAYKMVKEGKSVGEILLEFFKNSGNMGRLLSEETIENQFRIQNISKLFDLIKKYEKANPESNIFDYVDFLQYSIDIGENPKVEQELLDDYDAVTISTIHSAKGLEFPIVFLVNLVKGRFPSQNRSDGIPIPDGLIKETIEDIDSSEVHTQEERRLAYVGATRAKQYLYLTAASLYAGGVRKKKPSLFLNEILNRKVSEEDFDSAASSNSNGKTVDFAIHVSTNDDSLDIKDLNLKVGEWVSYSQLSMYERCPKQYKYSYVLGLPRPSNPALSFGISIHAALNYFYKKLIDAKSGLEGFNEIPTLEDLLNLYESSWVSSGYDGKKHEKMRYKFGKDMLKRYYNETFSAEELPLALEVPFKLKIDNSTVNGKIDRIDLVEDKDGIKTVNLIDYKTGKAKEEKDVKKNMQLAIYALAAEETLGLKVNTVGLWFVEHNKKVEFEVTDKMKLDAKLKIREIVEDMKKQQFIAKPNMFVCKFCDFKGVCSDSKA